MGAGNFEVAEVYSECAVNGLTVRAASHRHPFYGFVGTVPNSERVGQPLAFFTLVDRGNSNNTLHVALVRSVYLLPCY